jgi:hypothetical protein
LFVIATTSYSQQGKGLGSKPEYSCSLTGPVSTCPGTSYIPYTATLQGYNGAVKFQWFLLNNTAGAMLTGNISGITTDKSISINVVPASTIFNAGGHFNLRLIIYRGINADTCYINSHITPGQTVSINAAQSFQLFVPNRVVIGCLTNQTQLWAIATCGNPPYSYTWSSPLGTFSDIHSPTPIYMGEEGVITVQVRDANGSVVSASIIVLQEVCLPVPIIPIRAGNITIINDQQKKHPNKNILYQKPGINKFGVQPEENITIYPNPNRGTFSIRINNTGPVDVSLVNTLGITIQKWNSLHPETIQLKGYKPGIYTLLIFDRSTQKEISKKVVIRE